MKHVGAFFKGIKGLSLWKNVLKFIFGVRC